MLLTISRMDRSPSRYRLFIETRPIEMQFCSYNIHSSSNNTDTYGRNNNEINQNSDEIGMNEFIADFYLNLNSNQIIVIRRIV